MAANAPVQTHTDSAVKNTQGRSYPLDNSGIKRTYTGRKHSSTIV